MYKPVFSESLLNEIRSKFAYLNYDPTYGKRIFLDNAGGSLRLTESITDKVYWDLFPDCPLRYHKRALDINKIVTDSEKELLTTVFGASKGSIMTEISASSCFFKATRTIVDGVKGKNVVTSNVEHPSAYDSLKIAAERNNLEFRVVEVDKETGFINPQDVADLVDEDTVVVSIIAASNISGNIMDLKKINELIRKKKKDVYFISDAVQHMPHGLVDVVEEGLDFVNFALYKFFGNRGLGIGYCSERMSKLNHDKLIAKDDSEWMVGTPAPTLYLSTLKVIDYVCWIGSHFTESKDRRTLYSQGINKIAEQERALLYYALEGDKTVPGLRHIDNVTVHIDTEDLTNRDLIMAIEIGGISFEDVVEEYSKRGVTLFNRVNTSIYSKRIVEALGLTGAIRVSPLHCQNFDEIREFLIITKEIAEKFKK
ncbi:aminotransferase class V-fold PLP-dependent enzyme [Peptoniphilus catoniae]|uniref:aminotransferase class V-fold PLP-dependent enzyme n=1 Tax=Peptoniphilus catoniae TaxID=1660341 RepID=UPI0010FDAE2C|nr:aminotransferase class V-fold PLP-dependent enzyme [Peptoniphilus catoniae]